MYMYVYIYKSCYKIFVLQKSILFINQGARISLGPVVRITPDEVHLSDPSHYDTIYRVGTKFSKPASFYHAFGVKRAAFLLPSNDAHRIRRSAMSPFFSQ